MRLRPEEMGRASVESTRTRLAVLCERVILSALRFLDWKWISLPMTKTLSGAARLSLDEGPCWLVPASGKFTPAAARLADRHYSRRKVGSPQFMPPGETLVLLTPDEQAVFGWWRPHPASGLRAKNNLDGWTCTIFRNEGPVRSSLLVLLAELVLVERSGSCGPDGMLTYVDTRKVRSPNPGCCFLKAGWQKIGWSADGHKRLLHKAFDMAGYC